MSIEKEFLKATKKDIKSMIFPFDFDQHSSSIPTDSSNIIIQSIFLFNIPHGNNYSSNSNASINMKSQIILSAFIGILFSQAFAAPLAPAELAQDQVLTVLNFAPVGTPVANRVASPPAGTPIAKRAADDRLILNLPFQVVATPVVTPAAKRAACDTPTLCDSADVPIAKRAAQDDNDLPLRSTNGNIRGSGFNDIHLDDFDTGAADLVTKRDDALLPSVFAFAYVQTADEIGDDSTANNMARRNTGSVSNPTNDDMSGSGFYSIYWSDVTAEGSNDAPLAKRATAGSNDATADIRDSHPATDAN